MANDQLKGVREELRERFQLFEIQEAHKYLPVILFEDAVAEYVHHLNYLKYLYPEVSGQNN